MKSEFTPPTGTALEVLQFLHKRTKEVKGKTEYPTAQTVCAMIARCGIISIQKEFQDKMPGGEMAVILRGLVDSGLIHEFDDKGFPAFLPTSECHYYTRQRHQLTQEILYTL